MPSINPLAYISGVLGTLLLVVGVYSHYKISSLEDKLVSAGKTEQEYISAINFQTREILDAKADKEAALKKLQDWKELPNEEKFKGLKKKIYKDVKKQKEASREESTLHNNIYKLDWNNL